MTDDEIEKLGLLEKRVFQDSVFRAKRRKARETRKHRLIELLSWAVAAAFFADLVLVIYAIWSTLQ
jgi:hypothetical protein